MLRGLFTASLLVFSLAVSPMFTHGSIGSSRAVSSTSAQDGMRGRTQHPIVTGSSVLGLKYKDGVMLAADTLASYGSLARFKTVERIKTVGECTLVGGSGEYSDFQHIMEMLESMHQDDVNMDDGFQKSPSEHYNLLRTVMYNRRNKFNPLWNYLLVAGCKKDGTPFLGSVDNIGLLLEDCMRVLFYRDSRALNRIQIAKATSEGTLVSEPYTLETNWDIGTLIKPRLGIDSDGSW